MHRAAGKYWFATLLAITLTCLAAAATVMAQEPAAPTEAEVAQLIERVRSEASQQLVGQAAAVGNVLLRAGRYQEATALFATVAEQQPRDGAIIYRYALATFNSGETAKAEALAKRAVGLANEAPENVRAQQSADALVLLGVILAVEHNEKEALKWLEQAVALAPAHFDAQLSLGRLLFGMGDDSGAIKALSKAVNLQPANAQALFFLATTLERAGETQAALTAYRKLIAIKPEGYEGHLGLGAMLLKRGKADADEGLKELQLALRINPDVYEARVALGRALVGRGRPLEAIEHLQRAAELAPDNPEPHYQLSLAYRRLGRKEEAAAQAAIVKRIHESRRSPKVATQSRVGTMN